MWDYIVFSVRIVINEMDFMKTRDEDETANLIWSDSAVQHEKIAELRNYQVRAHGRHVKSARLGGRSSELRE